MSYCKLLISLSPYLLICKLLISLSPYHPWQHVYSCTMKILWYKSSNLPSLDSLIRDTATRSSLSNLHRSDNPLKLPGGPLNQMGPPGTGANYRICRGPPACREWTQSSLQGNSWLIFYISMFRRINVLQLDVLFTLDYLAPNKWAKTQRRPCSTNKSKLAENRKLIRWRIGKTQLFILAPILKNKKFYHNSTLNLRRWIIRKYVKPLTSNDWDTDSSPINKPSKPKQLLIMIVFSESKHFFYFEGGR